MALGWQLRPHQTVGEAEISSKQQIQQQSAAICSKSDGKRQAHRTLPSTRMPRPAGGPTLGSMARSAACLTRSARSSSKLSEAPASLARSARSSSGMQPSEGP